jgi:hypothetical protein
MYVQNSCSDFFYILKVFFFCGGSICSHVPNLSLLTRSLRCTYWLLMQEWILFSFQPTTSFKYEIHTLANKIFYCGKKIQYKIYRHLDWVLSNKYIQFPLAAKCPPYAEKQKKKNKQTCNSMTSSYKSLVVACPGGHWYVSNVSIIFDAPCLFLYHLLSVLLHFVAFLCIFQN